MQLADMFFYTRQEIVEGNTFYIHSNVFVTIFTERTRCCIVEGVFIMYVAFNTIACMHAVCLGRNCFPSLYFLNFFCLAGNSSLDRSVGKTRSTGKDLEMIDFVLLVGWLVGGNSNKNSLFLASHTRHLNFANSSYKAGCQVTVSPNFFSKASAVHKLLN